MSLTDGCTLAHVGRSVSVAFAILVTFRVSVFGVFLCSIGTGQHFPIIQWFLTSQGHRLVLEQILGQLGLLACRIHLCFQARKQHLQSNESQLVTHLDFHV